MTSNLSKTPLQIAVFGTQNDAPKWYQNLSKTLDLAGVWR
jgi:hypothetical protein